MGNFDFPKVWWGGGPYRLVGGQLPPLAPMVATALRTSMSTSTYTQRQKSPEFFEVGNDAFVLLQEEVQVLRVADGVRLRVGDEVLNSVE